MLHRRVGTCEGSDNREETAAYAVLGGDDVRQLFATAVPASADFSVVSSRAQFEQLIDGRELRRFGIRLTVTSDGQIVGRAFGGDVVGAWNWENGYFCRDLFYQGDDLGFNCQLVQVRGDTLRFTTDRGQGIYADLRLN